MHRTIKLLRIPAAAAALLTLAACAGGAVGEGEGPADIEATPSISAGPEGGDGPYTTESSEPTELPEPVVERTPNFKQKYTYDDGLVVEVTQIEKGKLTRAQIEDSLSSDKPGTAYATFTVRIKNGTPTSLKELGTEVSVTYGPDGKEADTTYAFSDTSIDGKIVKGRAKTGTYTFLVPEKWWSDVALEVQPYDDFARDSVVFTGSIK